MFNRKDIAKKSYEINKKIKLSFAKGSRVKVF